MEYTRIRTESMHRYPYPPLTRSKTAEPIPVAKRPTPRPRAQSYQAPRLADASSKRKAQDYTWVVEEEYVMPDKKNKKVERWVVEQQGFLPERSNVLRDSTNKPARRRTWEELMGGFEVESDKWQKQEAAARRAALEREKEKARVIEEDIRRIQARVQQKKENERKKMAEERWRATEILKERQRQDRAKTGVASIDVWRAHEAQWAVVTASTGPLSFFTMPWPMVQRPSQVADIVPEAIVAFLLSPLHSQNLTRKDRIRNALLRWHPDRFRKHIGRILETEMEAVEEGVGIVARCLNELMERETRIHRHSIRDRTW